MGAQDINATPDDQLGFAPDHDMPIPYMGNSTGKPHDPVS
jgi:hypothetical protein